MSPTTELDMEREADRLLSEAYAPPGVIIDEHMQVVHFRGRTGAYLEPAPGHANYDLLSMVRDGLRRAVSVAVETARESNRMSEVRAHLERAGREVKIRAAPLGGDELSPLLVVFDEADAPSTPATMADPSCASREELEVARARVQSEPKGTWRDLEAVLESCRVRHAELEAVNKALSADNARLSLSNAQLQARVDRLEESRIGLGGALNSLGLPIIVVTRELTIRCFNPAVSSISNLLASDVGRPLRHINLGLGGLDVNQVLGRVIDTEQVHTEEVLDAAGRWHRLEVHPQRVGEELDGLILLFVDIHDVKRARQEAALARDAAESVLAALPLPLLVLDTELRVMRTNPAFCRLFHLALRDVEGHRLSEIGGGQWNIPELISRLRDASTLAREAQHLEVRRQFPGAGCKELRVVARSIEGGAGVPPRTLIAIEDLGERGQQPLALAEPRASECLAAHPEEFLSVLSHELRNPLAPIMHAAAFLSHVRGLEPAAQEAASMIARKTAQIARLLDELLDVSKLSDGNVTLERQLVDLRAVIHRAVESTRPLIEARRHELSVSVSREPLVVDADPRRLEQVIANLLGNAAKYTPPGGYIRVDAIMDGEFALLRVKDSGVGISAEMLPRIFGLFTQADQSLARTGAGLGVGLRVVRRLVQLHGGTVEAHSDGEGKGSDFVVRWPLGVVELLPR